MPTSGQATGSPGFSVGVMSGSWQGLAAEAHARIVSDVAAAQARVVQARGLREDVERVRGSRTSPQRDLRVVVDGSGRLVDVWFAPPALAAAEAAAPWNDPRMGGPAGWWGAGSAEDWQKTTS